MLILLVLVAFMLSDVIAGIFTYCFMQIYEQFKKDIIAECMATMSDGPWRCHE